MEEKQKRVEETRRQRVEEDALDNEKIARARKGMK